MPINSNELATLRGTSLSDDQILDGLYHTSPEDQSDIDALKKGGLNSTQILNGFAQYDGQNQPQKSWLDTASDYLRAPVYGAQQELGRAAATERDALGADDAADAEQGAAQGLNAVTSGYDPASAHFEVTDPSTWSYAPRAALEGAPATGGYLGSAALGVRLGAFLGPEGALAGGVIGPLVYGLNRYLGTDAESRAANNGRSSVTPSDVLGALPGATAQAALDTAGSRLLGSGALSKVSPLAGVVRAVGANAALGGASDAAGQLGTTVGTKEGAQLNPATIADSAALSGVTTGGFRALGGLPEGLAGDTVAEGDPRAKARLAGLLNSDLVSGDPNNPADNQRMLATAGEILKRQTARETESLQQAIEDAQSRGADTSQLESAQQAARELGANLDTGYPLDDGQITHLTQHPAAPAGLANALADQSEFNRLQRAISGQQRPQASTTPLSAIRSALHAKHLLGIAIHNPIVGMGLAAPYAFRMAKRAAVAPSNPLGDLMRQFGGNGAQRQP